MTFLEQLESAPDYPDLLEMTLQYFHADGGTIHMLQPDGLLHLVAASRGIPEAVLAVTRTIPIGKGMAGLAVERKEPITACNLQTDTSGDVKPGARATGMEGALVVPILKGQEAVGALGIANRAERTFTEEESALLIEAGRVIGRRMHRQYSKREPGRHEYISDTQDRAND